MKAFHVDIRRETLQNEDFRRVLYTSHLSQVVVMSVAGGGEIGEEVHGVDQFLRCEQGAGTAILDGIEHPFSDGIAVLVPAGTRHNVINTSSDKPLKLYTVYAPPNHRDGKVHKTKAAAEADEERDRFDGKTSQ